MKPRQDMADGEAAPITPIDTFGFVKKMIGDILANSVKGLLVEKIIRTTRSS